MNIFAALSGRQAKLVNVRILMAALAAAALSACCAPAAAPQRETAFRAVVVQVSGGEVVVALASGELIGLEPSADVSALSTGSQVYVIGLLTELGTVEVTDLRKL